MIRNLFLGLALVLLFHTTGCVESGQSGRDTRNKPRPNRFGADGTQTVNAPPASDQDSSSDTSTSTTTTISDTPPPPPPPPHSDTPKPPGGPASAIAKKDYPYGTPVPGKSGFVTSPHAPYSGYVDVRGYPPGTEVKDPYTQKIFLVP